MTRLVLVRAARAREAPCHGRARFSRALAAAAGGCTKISDAREPRLVVTAVNAFQREILESLGTGEHYLLPLIYDCEARFPEQPRDLLLKITIGSICGLMRAGFVRAYRELAALPDLLATRDVDVSPLELHDLVTRGRIQFDEELGCWRLRGARPESAGIVLRLTERGFALRN